MSGNQPGKGPKGHKKGGDKKSGKRGFQEVKEEGSASKRAEHQMAGRDDDEDDDVDAIRKANAMASVKRQKKVEQKEKTALKKANKANVEYVKVSAQGGPSGQANPAHNKAGPKAEKGGKSQANAKDQVAKTASAQKQQRTKDGDKKKRPGSEEDEEENVEDDRQEYSDDTDSSSDDDDDDDDDDEGLSMMPKAHQKQKGKQEADDDSDDGSDFDELDVVFDSFDPKEDDFHGIKVFLTELLDGEAFDSSGMVDEVLANAGTVGTVVKVQDAEEVFGVMSVVSLRESKKETWAQQVEAFIASKCPQSLKSKLDKYVGPDASSHGGLIVSERLANMPQEMALPMMRSMFDEIKKAQKEAVSFDVHVLLVYTCICVVHDAYT
jgi:hypothetical protein